MQKNPEYFLQKQNFHMSFTDVLHLRHPDVRIQVKAGNKSMFSLSTLFSLTATEPRFDLRGADQASEICPIVSVLDI